MTFSCASNQCPKIIFKNRRPCICVIGSVVILLALRILAGFYMPAAAPQQYAGWELLNPVAAAPVPDHTSSLAPAPSASPPAAALPLNQSSSFLLRPTYSLISLRVHDRMKEAEDFFFDTILRNLPDDGRTLNRYIHEMKITTWPGRPNWGNVFDEGPVKEKYRYPGEVLEKLLKLIFRHYSNKKSIEILLNLALDVLNLRIQDNEINKKIKYVSRATHNHEIVIKQYGKMINDLKTFLQTGSPAPSVKSPRYDLTI